MTPKLKNAVMFLAIFVVLFLVYVIFLKPEPEEANLVSSVPPPAVSPAGASVGGASPAPFPESADFLSTLLSIRELKLDGSIFSDPAFISLRDGSIVLVQTEKEGRPNPFAPIGSEFLSAPKSPSPSGSPPVP